MDPVRNYTEVIDRIMIFIRIKSNWTNNNSLFAGGF